MSEMIEREVVLSNINDPLRQDPQFQLAVQEKQINKMAEIIEEMAVRLVSLEKKVMDMDEEARFPESAFGDYPEVSGKASMPNNNYEEILNNFDAFCDQFEMLCSEEICGTDNDSRQPIDHAEFNEQLQELQRG